MLLAYFLQVFLPALFFSPCGFCHSTFPGTVSFACELCQGVLPGSISFGAVCFGRLLTSSQARVPSEKETVNAYDGVANEGQQSSNRQ